ncbi:hypothetical protein, partial [Bilophila wadsworthia]|uniref:hypothetical protein n=1 Tax=Bilophila wadsworthia TaxID=35833 RepID=UPI003AB49A0A
TNSIFNSIQFSSRSCEIRQNRVRVQTAYDFQVRRHSTKQAGRNLSGRTLVFDYAAQENQIPFLTLM